MTSAVETGSVYRPKPTSTIQLPFDQPPEPTINPGTNGQSAQAVAATSPTLRRPDARRPTYAVATIVTAFAIKDDRKTSRERRRLG